MKEVFTMWRHTRLIVLVALSAAIYAAVLIPFKGFPIIPGHAEIRPANVFPFVFGLLFGPAGAWGSAIGNLIGDFFGTLTPGAIGGFVGNFFLALLPYKLWGAFFRNRNVETKLDSGKKIAGFVAIVIVASVFCAILIAWWNDTLGLVPFAALGSVITMNNSIAGLVLGPFLLIVLYPRIKRWGLLWTEIMRPEEVSAARFQKLGVALVFVGSIGGLVLGLLIGLGLYSQGLSQAGFAAGGQGGIGIALALIPFLAMVVIGSLMLGGREQVESFQEMLDADEMDEEEMAERAGSPSRQ